MSGAPLAALRAVLPGAPELVSGAGHDAAILAAAGVPSAMLFVRSLNGGVSHSPDELSSADDIELGITALASALGRIASMSEREVMTWDDLGDGARELAETGARGRLPSPTSSSRSRAAGCSSRARSPTRSA